MLINEVPCHTWRKYLYIDKKKTHKQYCSQRKYFSKIWYFYKTTSKILSNSIIFWLHFLWVNFSGIFFLLIYSLKAKLYACTDFWSTPLFSWSSCHFDTWYCCIGRRVKFVYFVWKNPCPIGQQIRHIFFLLIFVCIS